MRVAGDATSRGVHLAMTALKGEMGYPTALSAPGWGFQDVLFNKQELKLARPLESYVMENVLFKSVISSRIPCTNGRRMCSEVASGN